MTTKYTNIFHSKALQKFTQIKIFGLKTYNLATLVGVWARWKTNLSILKLDGSADVAGARQHPVPFEEVLAHQLRNLASETVASAFTVFFSARENPR
jgi:hypothetical protein